MTTSSTVAIASILAFAAYGCEQAPLGPSPAAAPSFNHGEPHGNPGGGGGGGDGGTKDAKAAFDITVTGGVTGSAPGIGLDRDNRRKIVISTPAGGVWAWNLGATQAAAESERTDPAADDTCWFVPEDMADAFKQTLVAHLRSDLQGEGLFVVNKEDSRGSISFVNEFDPWVSIGFNVQEDVDEHRPLVDDNGSGVDWSDGTQTRQFRYNPNGDDGGIVRTVMVIDPDAPAEQNLGELKCWMQDTILVVLAPASP